jgi:hypothetical protein
VERRIGDLKNIYNPTGPKNNLETDLEGEKWRIARKVRRVENKIREKRKKILKRLEASVKTESESR